MEYVPTSHICTGKVAVPARCGGAGYNPLMQGCCVNTIFFKATQRCEDSIIETKCGSGWYDAATHFCYNDATVHKKCGGSYYDPSTQFCVGTDLHGKCGGTVEWEPGTEQCCGSDKYATATHFCYGGNTVRAKCGGNEYSVSQFCYGYEVLDKCGGTAEWEPGTEQCCGSDKYATATHFCQAVTNDVKALCGGNTYTVAEFCYSAIVLGKCGGTANGPEYDLLTEHCCGSNKYATATHFCDARDSKIYKAVFIGSQAWMAENLNYKTEDGASRCYPTSGNTNTSDADNANCTTYGRLYNWATAMELPPNCNTCVPSYLDTKGICPDNWHIPSDAEWTVLTDFVGGWSDAGSKLKATSGWNDYNGSSGNGTDDYGFAALPGGGRNDSYSGFIGVGSIGYWWSRTGDTHMAHVRMMNPSNSVSGSYRDRTGLSSVRCVWDGGPWW
jgi:uncharacterized protein (TIGR02145 family)